MVRTRNHYVTKRYVLGTFQFHIFAPMATKNPKPRERKPNFPLVFWDGLKSRAEAVAATEHGGNLTTMINTVVKAYVERMERKGGK